MISLYQSVHNQSVHKFLSPPHHIFLTMWSINHNLWFNSYLGFACFLHLRSLLQSNTSKHKSSVSISQRLPLSFGILGPKDVFASIFPIALLCHNKLSEGKLLPFFCVLCLAYNWSYRIHKYALKNGQFRFHNWNSDLWKHSRD